MRKPTTIARVEFIENLIQLINSSDLPAFVIEPILSSVLLDVRKDMDIQYKRDLQAYNEALEIESKKEIDKK